MFHRLFAYFICFVIVTSNVILPSAYAEENPPSFVFNETELLKQHPDARVIRVSAEEYLTLEKKLQQRGYRQSKMVPLQLAQNEVSVATRQQDDSILEDDCINNGDESAGEESFRLMIDFTDDMMRSGNGSSGDEAAVLFVVVGTVVVIVWALYVFKYLYDVSLGNATCGGWKELTVVSSAASTSGEQHAHFNGLRYAMGFREGSLDVGIDLELGQTDILLSDVGVLELKGRYWFLGPVLRWRLSQGINPGYFQMNFSAGSTEHDEVGLLAKASLGLIFGLGDSMQLGFNWGAMNINLNDNQGIISERSQYHYLYGVNMGFRF